MRHRRGMLERLTAVAAAGLLATTGLTLLILPVAFTLVQGVQAAILGRRGSKKHKESS